MTGIPASVIRRTALAGGARRQLDLVGAAASRAALATAWRVDAW